MSELKSTRAALLERFFGKKKEAKVVKMPTPAPAPEPNATDPGDEMPEPVAEQKAPPAKKKPPVKAAKKKPAKKKK